MSDDAPAAKAPNKFILLIKQSPTWLWITTIVSTFIFIGFLYFLSQQKPDQYAMTLTPAWQHGMNYPELIAYHRAVKASLFRDEEAEAKEFLYQQKSSQMLAQSNLQPRALNQNSSRSLTYEEAAGFASATTPPQSDVFSEVQRYARAERNGLGFNSNNYHFVQTASLRDKKDAEALRAQLIMKGFDPFIQEAYVNNKLWYRVRLGPFKRVSDARSVARDLKNRKLAAQVIQSSVQ